MTDNYDDIDHDDDGPAVRNMRERIKQLEADAKAAADAKAEAEAANRKLAVYEAGLNGLSDKQMKALLATADDHSAEALKSAAADLGFVKQAAEQAPAPQEQAQANTQADLAAFARTGDAAAGVVPQPAAQAVDRMLEVKRALENAGPMQMESMRADAIKVIEQVGLRVGQDILSHDGTFSPS